MEKPSLTSFGISYGVLVFSCRNYFNGGLKERYTKDKYFLMKTLRTTRATTCRTFSIDFIKKILLWITIITKKKLWKQAGFLLFKESFMTKACNTSTCWNICGWLHEYLTLIDYKPNKISYCVWSSCSYQSKPDYFATKNIVLNNSLFVLFHKQITLLPPTCFSIKTFKVFIVLKEAGRRKVYEL